MKDQRPAPGIFSITFPTGSIPEIKTFGDLITQGQIALSPCDALQTPLDGDAPSAALSKMAMSFLPGTDKQHPTFGNAFSVAFYDWIRRGGTNWNVESLMTALSTPLKSSPTSQINEFQVSPQGTVSYNVYSAPAVNLPVSQNQWRALSGIGFASSNKQIYDLQLTDFVYQPGRVAGGMHGGEPLDTNNSLPDKSFLSGPGGSGAVRPTYQTSGVAVDFTFQQRPGVTLP